jgi:hypothetical protein
LFASLPLAQASISFSTLASLELPPVHLPAGWNHQAALLPSCFSSVQSVSISLTKASRSSSFSGIALLL